VTTSAIDVPRYEPWDEGTHPPLDSPGYLSTKLRAPFNAPVDLPQRLTEVTGPLFGETLVPELDADLTRQHEGEPQGQRIVLHGRVLDGAGRPIAGSLVEIWQANAAGRYAHPEDTREELPLEDGFTGFGRCATDSEGRFEFTTIKPGPVPGPDDRLQAPHIDVSVFARGLLNRLVTRIYFPDEEEANGADPVLALIEDEALRRTLIARPEDGALRFDIRLQGEGQTAFFSI
jgi:protocatechuate 3,4-dioxygenase beta subunit